MTRSSSKSRRTAGAGEKRNRGVPFFAVLLVVVLVAATLVVLYLTKFEDARHWFVSGVGREEPADPALLALRVEQGAMEALRELGVARDQLSVEGADADGAGSGLQVWEAPLPAGVPLEKANLALTKAVEGAGGRILDGREWRAKRDRRRCLTLVAAVDSIACLELSLYEAADSGKVQERPLARLAVVMTEMGRELDGVARRAIQSPLALTIAVLPGHPASGETARIACQSGKEVLLHLPMEPMNYPRRDPGEGAVLLDHSAREIRRRVRGHLKEIGCARGVMSYMGSAAMRDRDLMHAALGEIKEDGLFFLDGSGSVHSVVLDTAGGLGVPCLLSVIPLETDDGDSGLMAKRMEGAERVALQRGKALVVAKPTDKLLELLASRAGGYGPRGIALVKASDLLEDE